ncbi:GAF and ANTAR domain-containing protein [Nakamurella endophytica]|uniref:GAF and ANTAR domain-containing protein n=1 Tax=Nakamurella endophytica TaxID=1748367 RepID=UPI00166D1F38|nr:GAF and ANTAR domain-containing protein [Nakamurella endophytica]
MTDVPTFEQLVATVALQLSAEPDTRRTVQRVVDIAADRLGSDVGVSVSLVGARQQVQTAGSSDDRAVRADRLQYLLAEGPCLDAIRHDEQVEIQDLQTERRYPRWCRQAADEVGVASSLSFCLSTGQHVLGALNLYSVRRETFDDQLRAEGRLYAAQAAIAVHRARTQENLRAAVDTRTVIGQAEGILMERLKITAEEAFQLLRNASQHSNVQLREVAERLAETGAMPPS